MLSASLCTDCTTDGAADEWQRDQGRTRVSLDLWVLVDTAKEGVDILIVRSAGGWTFEELLPEELPGASHQPQLLRAYG